MKSARLVIKRIISLAQIVMICMIGTVLVAPAVCNAQSSFVYKNTLTKIEDAPPIFSDYPDFVEPLLYEDRFSALPVVYDENGEIIVRSWRYWYNARGIIEMGNRLDAEATAIINLMAWGFEGDGESTAGRKSGIVDFASSTGNAFFVRQVREVINPFLKRLGGHVVLIGHTLPGKEDPVRTLLYPSISTGREELNIEKGTRLLKKELDSYTREKPQLDNFFTLDSRILLTSYFLNTPSIPAVTDYTGSGFAELPLPLVKGLVRRENDIVFYDGDGYDTIHSFLKVRGIRHIIVLGFLEKPVLLPTHPRADADESGDKTHTATGLNCTIENLGKDFNIFLVGDAMRTTFPSSTTPRFATQAALSNLSGKYMITQVNFVTVSEK